MQKEDTTLVAPEELQAIFSSKSDLYRLLSVDRKLPCPFTVVVDYVLPSPQKCPMHYLRDILAGRKKVGDQRWYTNEMYSSYRH